MRRLTILLAAIGALLLIPAAAAQATATHPYLPGRSLNGSTTPSGSFGVGGEGTGGVAVDSQGDIYVGDIGHEYIDVFKPNGAYLTRFESPFFGTYGLAVDGEGVVYAVRFSGEVERFEPSAYPFAGTPSYSELGPISESVNTGSVAVDPSNNHVYVDSSALGIVRYKSAAEGSGEIGPMPGEAGATIGCVGLAVYGATHDVYCSEGAGKIKIFNGATGNLKQEITASKGNAGPSVGVDQSNGDVYYYYAGEKTVYEFTPSGKLVSQIGPKFGVEEKEFQTTEPSQPAVDPTTGDIFVGSLHNVYAFAAEIEGGGPTNLRTLTIAKSANGPGGTGSVSSKPKGIKCGTTCSEAVARMYKSTPVELLAKPTLTTAFVKWSNPGGACDESTNPVCVVPMAEDESLEAIFSGTSKTIAPTETLTLSKGASEASFGKGTVKAAGLTCEAECDSTKVLYQGPITEPKAKPGKVVILKQAPAFGSKFTGWSGCDSVTEAGECVVEMDEDHTIEAEYEALPNKALTVNKPYSTGNGSVSSKPKGIKCGSTCTQAVAQMPEGAKVELLAKPGLETTFVEWVGGDCAGSTNPVCVVTMNADETTKAVFSKAGKAFAGGSEPTLTLNKEGSGFGTVKAAGLTCEVLCSSTKVLFQGPITEPKAKPGKTAILKAASAPGSTKVAWTGCDSVTEAGECVVEMDENHTITASFDELE